MVTRDLREPAQTRHECFLCTLDQQPFDVPKLEGYIISADEFKDDGVMTPLLAIDIGNEYGFFSLTRNYRRLVKGLMDIGDLRKRRFFLRVYHLPAAAISAKEYKGSVLHRYRANDYTLAILEPDTILNITDLNHAEYCARQYLLKHLASSPQSAAAIRGNLVHSSFKELLKEYDRGELITGYAAKGDETQLQSVPLPFHQ